MVFPPIIASVSDEIPLLTLGELVVLHQLVDFELNRQLNLAAISDTLDLRSGNIRKEVFSFDAEVDKEENRR